MNSRVRQFGPLSASCSRAFVRHDDVARLRRAFVRHDDVARLRRAFVGHSRAARLRRAFTMMELLVTLGILAMALASVLSIFARGSQFGLRAQERTEGGRVAQAVFDLVDRGFMIGTRRGRRDDGSLLDETTSCQELDFLTTGARELDGMQFRSLWEPTYVIRSHLDLVWHAEVTTPSPLPPPASPELDWTNLQGVHVLVVTVRFDGNDNGTYDELAGTPERLQPDRLVGEYYAILADRKVSP